MGVGRSVLMSFTVVFGNKKSTVCTGRSVNSDGGHAKGFKTHCPASVGMPGIVGDIEMLTAKAVDERSCMVFSVGHDETLQIIASRQYPGY